MTLDEIRKKLKRGEIDFSHVETTKNVEVKKADVKKSFIADGITHFIKVSPDINYIATDANGKTWGYREKPQITKEDDTMWMVNDKDTKVFKFLGYVSVFEHFHWDRSLRKLVTVSVTT